MQPEHHRKILGSIMSTESTLLRVLQVRENVAARNYLEIVKLVLRAGSGRERVDIRDRVDHSTPMA